jgi:hypothetical protein
MIKIIIYAFVAFVIFVVASRMFSSRNTACVLRREYFSISTVSHGKFLESIPIVGSVFADSSHQRPLTIKVPIDKMYLSRVHTDLLATTTVTNTDYALRVTEILPGVVNGRFYVMINFINARPMAIPNQNNVRLRPRRPGARTLAFNISIKLRED